MRRPPPWSDEVLSGLEGVEDDRERLRRLSGMVLDAKVHADRVVAERDTVALRLRDNGKAMIDIARWARVTDAYLSRRLLAQGARRRVGRRE